MAKERLDKILVARGMVASREKAHGLILAGQVLVAGHPVTKAGHGVAVDAEISIRGDTNPYVSRGGLKLAHALATFAIDVRGATCLDAGASTGGFTDCLLQHGAAQVTAVDVGYGQLAWSLRQDPRVVVLERTHLRDMLPTALPALASIVTLDLSFISLTKIFAAVDRLTTTDAQIIALIKPQFEVGRANVGKGGIVRDEVARAQAVQDVIAAATQLHWHHRATTESPIHGADGNVEFLGHFLK